MCGIVGLHLKNPDLQPRLGELLTVMLEAMTTRGPDSAGIAVYSDPAASSPGTEPELRYSLRSDTGTDWELLGKALDADTGSEVGVRRLATDSAVLESPAAEAVFVAAVRDSFACKPAVIAETGDYVAMASEYQALTRLPGITGAEVFEPKPEEICLWSR
jgi:glutamate synthase domain-containing protein 1